MGLPCQHSRSGESVLRGARLNVHSWEIARCHPGRWQRGKVTLLFPGDQLLSAPTSCWPTELQLSLAVHCDLLTLRGVWEVSVSLGCCRVPSLGSCRTPWLLWVWRPGSPPSQALINPAPQGIFQLFCARPQILPSAPGHTWCCPSPGLCAHTTVF